MSHQAKKRFGQNFLEDKIIIGRIIDAIKPVADDNMLEVGPGLGALTAPLLTKLNKLTAIEIDTDIQQHLKAQAFYQKLTLIEQDALTVPLDNLGPKLRIVGNLPYNISTPLLFHFLQFGAYIKDMHFMLQKEVVDRLAASPGTKAYGRLTIMAQAQCDVQPLFIVPPDAFKPKPKVDSAIVRLIPKAHRPEDKVLSKLNTVLTQAFSMRRKTLSNSLKSLPKAAFSDLGIDPKLRIENLSVDTCIKLAQYLSES